MILSNKPREKCRGEHDLSTGRRPGRKRHRWLITLVCLLAVGCAPVQSARKPPANPYIRPPKEEPNSRFGSLFRPKEPEPPQSVTDFLRLQRP